MLTHNYMLKKQPTFGKTHNVNAQHAKTTSGWNTYDRMGTVLHAQHDGCRVRTHASEYSGI